MIAGASNRGMSSVWEAVVRDLNDRVKTVTQPHSNVRTNAGGDLQANQMFGGPSMLTGIAQRTATATSATQLTDSGAAFPTTANINGGTGGLVGCIVACGPNASGTGSTVYGVITNNDATHLNIDRWVSAGSPFAAGTTPDPACKYQVLPGGAPGIYLALSNTVQAGSSASTTLAGEATTGTFAGFGRAAATSFTHTVASATYTIAKTFVAGSTFTVNSEAVFNGSGTPGITVTLGGVEQFENAEPNAPTLVSGDTLAQTVSVTY